MRDLYRYTEAAEKYYAGDVESLRHALLLGAVRARVELCQRGHWAWWVDDNEDSDTPDSGRSQFAQWERRRHGEYDLTGWFYLSARDASRIAHNLDRAGAVVVSVDEDEESFFGLMFWVQLSMKLDDLWFEPSEYPDRSAQPEDEVLDYMADHIAMLTDQQSVIARFEAAAAIGGERFDSDAFGSLQREYEQLRSIQLVKATIKFARAPQSKGGMAKAAKNASARDAVRASWAKHDKKGRGIKTAFITAQAATHCVSPRTIENWLK